MPKPPIEPGYFTAKQAAAYLNVSMRSFHSWAKDIPHYRPPGNRSFYRKLDLDLWMEHQRVLPKTKEDLDRLVDEVLASVLGAEKQKRGKLKP